MTGHRDRRCLGPSREELFGQRAHQRSSPEMDTVIVTDHDDDELSVPEIPELENDVYLLDPDVSDGRSRRRGVLTPLQGLALDTALCRGGDAVWLDAQRHSTTHSLSSVAPSERALERVHVARVFTTHQHHTLLELLGRWMATDRVVRSVVLRNGTRQSCRKSPGAVGVGPVQDSSGAHGHWVPELTAFTNTE